MRNFGVTDDLADDEGGDHHPARCWTPRQEPGPFPAQSSRMRTDVPPPGQAFDGLCEPSTATEMSATVNAMLENVKNALSTRQGACRTINYPISMC
jgi:hypothetical protein